MRTSGEASIDQVSGKSSTQAPQAAVSLHGRPTVLELLEAVREFLSDEVLAATEGRLQFLTRVTVRVLETVSREIEFGRAQESEHVERLAALGWSDEAELVEAIRAGLYDDRMAEIAAVLEADVLARIEVANPRYVE